MKPFLRDTVITAVALVGLTALYRHKVQANGPLVRIVCLHDVKDAVWLESVISLFLKNYNVITPEDFEKSNFDPKRINILLTFDDGYESWTTTVAPVLQKYNLLGLFFLNSGLLDCAGDVAAVQLYMKEQLRLKNPRSPLSWAGALSLVSAGHSIGGHSKTHVSAGLVSTEVWRKEVVEDKIRLEKKLGVTLSYFAYPFGRLVDIPKASVPVVVDGGYRRIFSAQSGFVTDKGALLPRTLLEQEQSVRQIQQWVEGGYDLFQALKSCTHHTTPLT